jgi:hypothetical protein
MHARNVLSYVNPIRCVYPDWCTVCTHFSFNKNLILNEYAQGRGVVRGETIDVLHSPMSRFYKIFRPRSRDSFSSSPARNPPTCSFEITTFLFRGSILKDVYTQ